MARRVSRCDLYGLVWARPMIHVATDFGITGNGLAKICERLDIPCPPRGYWAKKAAGVLVVQAPLPKLKSGTPESVDIYPTPTRVTLPEVELPPAVVQAIGNPTVPDEIDNLHTRVKAWLTEHKREQSERAKEIRKHGNEQFYWGRGLLPDLTKRDLYRFRATSAIFTAVERAGGKILEAPINGKVSFLVSNERLDCSIVEKMFKPIQADKSWTAYPEHHQTGLNSSGFLRVAIKTYLGCKEQQWIETKDTKIAHSLKEIVGGIVSAGPILVRLRQEREDAKRRDREEEARRYERQRAREIDDQRWERFQSLASNWAARDELLTFVAEIKRRGFEDAAMANGRPLAEWVAWAEGRIGLLDPFGDGVAGLFESISR